MANHIHHSHFGWFSMPGKLSRAWWACALIAPIALAADKTSIPISMDGSDPKTWDLNQDGVLVAAQNHKIVYEDNFVRVQSVTVPAGTEESYHLHPYWSVLVNAAQVQAEVINRDASGQPAQNWRFADLMVKPAFIAIAPPTPLHSIKPAGAVTDRVIRVEFKTAVVPQLRRPTWANGKMPLSNNGSDPRTWDIKLDGPSVSAGIFKPVFEDAVVRIEAIAVPAGKSLPLHTQRYPGVSIDYSNLPAAPQVELLAPQAPYSESASQQARRVIFIGYKQGLPKTGA